MMRILLTLFISLLIGCATLVTHPQGTVLEKFAREMYFEAGALYLDHWIPVGFGHETTWWVSIQGDGYRFEYAMKKEEWDKTKVGDFISLPEDHEGGT